MMIAAQSASAAVPEGVEPSVLLPTVGGKISKEPAIFWQHKGQWFADAETWAHLGVVLQAGETMVSNKESTPNGPYCGECTQSTAQISVP